MTDLVEKLIITVAVCVFALSYTLRSVEAGSMPSEQKQIAATLDMPDPVDSGAAFEAR